jgi:hypothetical protein
MTGEAARADQPETIEYEPLPCADFGGSLLEFIYAHLDERCKADAVQLLNSTVPGADDVAAALNNPMLRAQAIRVVTEGVSQPTQRLGRRADYNNRSVEDSLDSTALRRAFAGGSTVVVEDVGKWHPHVASICNTIFNERWLYANAAYFMTRSGNRGLPFHADEETTFVFQVAGSKIWHVADYAERRLGAAEVPRKARVFQFDLRPGNAACIPPMHPHRTEAVGGLDSIHLTIGVRQFKLKDFFTDFAQRGTYRVPVLDQEVASIDSSIDTVINALHGSSGEEWRREFAISSIRVASGSVDRGFEFACQTANAVAKRDREPVLGDLIWKVRLGSRWLVHHSGAFAVMDDSRVDALAAAVALRSSEGCTWQQLAGRGRVPPSVQQFLRAAGWDIGVEARLEETGSHR